MISSVFYVIAVACEPGYLCQDHRFTDMPEFSTYLECQAYREELASAYVVENGLWICVTDPAEKAAGGASDEEELVVGI